MDWQVTKTGGKVRRCESRCCWAAAWRQAQANFNGKAAVGSMLHIVIHVLHPCAQHSHLWHVLEASPHGRMLRAEQAQHPSHDTLDLQPATHAGLV